MGIYSGAEIFQIAMELDESGRDSYETLAEKSEDHDLADLCRDLAVQEADHYRKFKKMGEELVERPGSRPLTWDELHFAQMLIEERVLSDPEAARDAAASGDVAALLETAIRLEKDSVLLRHKPIRLGDSLGANFINTWIAKGNYLTCPKNTKTLQALHQAQINKLSHISKRQFSTARVTFTRE